MRMSAAVLVSLLLCASLSGCGGGAAGEVSALKLATGVTQIRGVDVWSSVESIFPKNRVVYQEYAVVNPAKKELAIPFQDPAPSRVGLPGPDETSPLTFENAAKNLVTALDGPRKLLEGDLSYDAVEQLTVASARVVLHAREAVKALEVKDRELRMSAERGGDGETAGAWKGANVISEDDEARALVKHWMPRARLIEHNARNLWVHSATHRKAGIEGWSIALMDSCVELEEAYSGRRRRRPATQMEIQESGKEGPGTGVGEGPDGGAEEGPAKAANPGAEEHPETGSGSPPVDKDGKPDAGPPQVGAFLLGVAGRRRSSRSGPRSRRRAS